MWRDDAYLLDILIAARKALEFTKGMSEAEFKGNEIVQFATVRAITIIGEAANRVSREYCEAHPEIPWKEMAGMRYRLVHDYFQIDVALVWQVVRDELPGLVERIAPLVPPDTGQD